MEPGHFEILPGAPPDYHEYTESHWLWLIRIKQFKYGKVVLVNGENLIASSNNPLVVPNDDLVFKGKTGSERRRIIEFYGLSQGTTMLEIKDVHGNLKFALQIQVTPISGKVPSFIALKAPQQALNSHDTPGPYHMVHTETVKGGEKAATIVGKIAAGVNHVAISCHSSKPGVLEIGENIDASNVKAFADLRAKTSARVIWIGACSVAGSREGMSLCKEMAQKSGCYVVAPGITAPAIKTPLGRVEFWGPLLPHYFDPKGNSLNQSQFLMLASELGFTIEGKY
jgi:hypothetical protein